jgi:hypothetical protein
MPKALNLIALSLFMVIILSASSATSKALGSIPLNDKIPPSVLSLRIVRPGRNQYGQTKPLTERILK